MKKSLLLPVVLCGVALSFTLTSDVEAATLVNVKDQITTSRPSPSTVITGQFNGGFTLQDNKSRFLASDSAKIINVSSGAVANTYTVAYQSTDLTNLYVTSNPSTLSSATFVAATPITAMHKVQFTTATGIPSGGSIQITFPGSASNTASPSATTFAFNGLSNSEIAVNNASCNWTVSSPSVTCTTTAAVNPGTTVTILLGCSAQASGDCTTSAPRLINPTKSAVAGTANNWSVSVTTKDGSSNTLDTGRATIGVIDAVEVKAQVDPTLTFTIAGIADGTALSGVATGCSDTTNAGSASTATLVDLGILTNGSINKAAQKLTVSTNAAGGYVISATSSGKLINPATGYHIAGLNSDTALTANDTPAPATFGASGTDGFGISPCGTRVNTTLWGSGATAFSSGSKYSNPYNSGNNSYYATLATFTGTTGVSLDDTVVRYAGSVSGTTPAGIYRNHFTYVATATF